MITVGHIHELGRDPKFVAGFAHTALQNRTHMQLLADFVEDVVLVLAFESEARTASGHTQAFHFRQNVDQLFSHPVAQVFVALVRAHVHERQHRD